MMEIRFPSFGFAENRLRSSAMRRLLLAVANRKHDLTRCVSVALLLATSYSLALAQVPPDEEVDPDPVQQAEQPAEGIEAVPDLVEEIESDPAIDARAVEARPDEEFDPDEEISEDYPIPLPSDI